MTSAQAAARLLADDLPEGSKVYLIGGEGLDTALGERGLVPVTSPAEEPVAVVQGYGPDMPWRQVVAGAILVRDGLPWVASNTDLTIPTRHGRRARATARWCGWSRSSPGVSPWSRASRSRRCSRRPCGGSAATDPLVVGDRLDTDIEGAHNAGWDSLLVLTGVTGLDGPGGGDAAAASDVPRRRPGRPGRGAAGRPEMDGTRASAGRLDRPRRRTARCRSTETASPGTGGVRSPAAAWAHLDEHGDPADTSGLTGARRGPRVA